ncbi:MAG: electron transfer flavoprotein subunit alpha/FixB family protein [Myxococcota bacterium]
MTIAVCSWGEGSRGAPESLTLARGSLGGSGEELRWVVLDPAGEGHAEIGARFGATAVDRIWDEPLADFPDDACVEALAQYCKMLQPRVLIFPQSFQSHVVAPRLAGRLETAVVMNVVSAQAPDASDALQVTASAFGGDTRVVYALSGPSPYILGVGATAVQAEPLPDPVPAIPVNEVAVDLAGVDERVRVVERARAEGPRLEDAEIIVSGGRGLGSQENYKLIQELASALGGMAGASRPLVDDGWVDASRQVGLTGKITRPSLYVAVGISGASQHMAGCAAAKTLVAINRDRDAAIFRYARYGIEGDCLEILPELIRAARED